MNLKCLLGHKYVSMKNENAVVEVIETAEEVVVEIVKAPFKIADKLFDWMIGE